MPASVYPTGTVHYDPTKCWSGYTLFGSSLHAPNGRGAVLMDMNGNLVNRWKGLDGMPNKMLPGGRVLGSSGVRPHKYGYQDMLDVVQVDWDGNVEWKFDHLERIKDPRRKPRWMARQHHDYQREGNPVGYYVPGADPCVDKGYTYVLCHKTLVAPAISAHTLVDDVIIQVDWDGRIVWEWTCSEHFEELGFDEAAKNTLARNPNIQTFMGPGWGDWMHLNSCSLVGPNKWWDEGDDRFHPDNLIVDGRQTNIVFIISRATGNIVWKMGPDYTVPALKEIGQVIGQHHAHVIPAGLPGAGNVMLFDNGGAAGFGSPNPGSPNGVSNARRESSRVIEFDPTTLKMVWSYPKAGPGPGPRASLFSGFVCSAQRLPNGNTLITEGNDGRLIEVTPEGETVWEYLSPYPAGRMGFNLVYRAYRVPYHWVPQVDKPEEVPVARPDNNKFRVPGTVTRRPLKVTPVKF
jgi:hypothetical protein